MAARKRSAPPPAGSAGPPAPTEALATQESRKPDEILSPNGAGIAFSWVSLTELQRWPRNPKEHDLPALEQSFRRFGYVAPILVDRGTGCIVAGHGRLDAMQARKARGQRPPKRIVVKDGEWYLPVVTIEFESPEEAEAYLLADNQLTIRGGWDEQALLAMLSAQIDRGIESLEGTGFSAEDVDALTRKLAGQTQAPERDPAPGDPDVCQAKWQVAEGHLYEIPSLSATWRTHRLLCGDAQRPEAYAAVLTDRKADLVFTDPPYGVSYQSAALGGIASDTLTGDRLASFLALCFQPMTEAAHPDAAFYIWHASATRREFEWAMAAAGLEEKQYLVWIKESFTLGHADYHWQHEPCYYAQKAGQAARFFGTRDQATVWRFTENRDPQTVTVALANGLVLSNGDGRGIFLSSAIPKTKKVRIIRPGDRAVLVSADQGDRSDTWEVKREAGTYVHPTQKPTALAERAMRNSSEPGHVVLDPFAGSGVTLVAAERTQRRAALLDADPRFVAVILERATAMGLTPRRIA